MSCLFCDRCADLIDTDEDPEAYVERLQRWLCESCRERVAIQKEPGLNDF